MKLPDIQAIKDERNISINQAGIENLLMPISILKKDKSNCNTTATIKCGIYVEPSKKGINMSRLPIYLSDNGELLTLNKMLNSCKDICNIAESRYCYLSYKFPYFLTKNAPVSELPGIVKYNVIFETSINAPINQISKKITVETIASTCCPCSKEISLYNAHNQKCYITLSVDLNKDADIIYNDNKISSLILKTDDSDIVWIEDLINICEESASCPIYTVLKRPDEKFVTEKMYDRPRFVEDVVREVALRVDKMKNIKHYIIKASADESIHMHKAYAIKEK